MELVRSTPRENRCDGRRLHQLTGRIIARVLLMQIRNSIVKCLLYMLTTMMTMTTTTTAMTIEWENRWYIVAHSIFITRQVMEDGNDTWTMANCALVLFGFCTRLVFVFEIRRKPCLFLAWYVNVGYTTATHDENIQHLCSTIGITAAELNTNGNPNIHWINLNRWTSPKCCCGVGNCLIIWKEK